MSSILRTIALAFSIAACAHAGTLIVATDGSGDYTDIQSALDAARDGDIVVVKPGTYIVDAPLDFNRLFRPLAPTDPPLKNVTLRAEAGPAATTVRMAAVPRDADRASVVVFENGENENSILEGFTLLDGRGTDFPGIQNQAGGAIHCRYSAPTVVNCVISGNTGRYGGGVWLYRSAARLIECTITANRAVAQEGGGIGGGVYVSYRHASNAQATLSGCTVAENAATGDGGGIFCNAGAGLALSGCVVARNDAHYGSGGGVLCESASLHVAGSRIAENHAGGHGGGIACRDGATAVVDGCTIERNFAARSESGAGGGIGCFDSTLSISRTHVRDNRARVSGGGIRLQNAAGSSLHNCRITGNWASGEGGGISCNSTDVTAANCILSGNYCPHGGSAARAESGSLLTFRGCTIAGNWASASYRVVESDASSAFALAGSIVHGNAGIALDGLPRLQAESSCLESASPWPGAGNTNSDPAFYGEGAFDFTRTVSIQVNDHAFELPAIVRTEPDYHLRGESPILDRGTCLEDLLEDLDGNPRPMGAGCDMGAYEYTDPVRFADANLARAVREALGLPADAPIFVPALMTLKSLDARGLGIASLAGLEHARNLEALFVTGNNLSDLRPISGLTALQSLAVSANPLRAWAYSVDLARVAADNPGVVIEHDPVVDAVAPRILRAQALHAPNTPSACIQIAFGEAIDPAGAQLPTNFALLAPDGSAVAIDTAQWAAAAQTLTLTVNGGTPLAEGLYALTVCAPSEPDDPAGLRDAAGNPLDGNGDGIGGDGALLALAVDFTGPRVTVLLPDAPQPGPVAEAALLFNEPVVSTLSGGSISAADIRLEGPDGAIAVSSVTFDPADAARCTIAFPPQPREGVYRLSLGHDIADLRGNRIDQNRDGLPDDGTAYEGRFVIRGARVIACTPSGGVRGPIDALRVTFDEDMDPSSFDPARDLIVFSGPRGAIAAAASAWTDARTLTVTFAPVADPGPYKVILAETVLNRAGTPLDQDGDCGAGEVPDDRFVTCFQILREPARLAGVIAVDRSFQAGDFCLVEDNVVVTAGAALRFGAGCRVKCAAGASVKIEGGGVLEASGTPEQPVVFTSWRDDHVEGDTDGDGDGGGTLPSAGDWEGIVLTGTAPEAVLRYAEIRYAERALEAQAGNVLLEGATLRWNTYGVVIKEPLVESRIENCLIAENGSNGLYLRADARHVIRNSTIARNGWDAAESRFSAGIHLGAATLTMTNVIVAFNRIGLDHSGDTPVTDVSFCDFYNPDGADITWGPDPGKPEIWKRGNISADPLFAGGSERGYELRAGSPAIDAGTGDLTPVHDLLGRPRHDDPATADRGAAEPSFCDMGALEWQGESTRPDLRVTDVTVDRDRAAPGDLLVMTWTVVNAGQEPAQGPWTEEVLLSPDGFADPGDVRIARYSNEHSLPPDGILQPGERYEVATIAQLPSCAGVFKVLVRADAEGRLAEARTNNNVAQAPAELSVDVPVLAGGTAVEATVRRGQWTYFRFDAPPDGSFRVRLQPRKHMGTLALYVRCGSAPTLQHYDAFSADAKADQEIALAGACRGTIFIGVYGQSLPSPERSFTLTVEETALAITKISPARAGASARVTILVEGDAFRPGAQARLITPGGASIEGDEGAVSPCAIPVTFDLPAANAAPGIYDLAVTNPDGASVTLPGAFTVEAASYSGLVAKLELPERVRPNRAITATVRYWNMGNTDIPAPMFAIEADTEFAWQSLIARDGSAIVGELRDGAGICPYIRFPDGVRAQCNDVPPDGGRTDANGWLRGTRYEFVARGAAAPAVLRPGESGEQRILLRTPPAAGTIPFRLYGASPGVTSASAPIDWNALGAKLRPAGVQDASWDAFMARLRRQIGETGADFHAMLSANAAYLEELGLQVRDVEELIAFEFLQAELAGEVPHLETARDAASPAPALPLSFERYFLPAPLYRARLGALGRGWTHSYAMGLRIHDDRSVTMTDASGFELFFRHDGNGGYTTPSGIYAVLRADDDGGFSLARKDGLVHHFAPDGKFDRATDPRGNYVTARYDADGLLREVAHSNGDVLGLSYERGRLAVLTDPFGRETRYTYDAAGEHLLAVRGPDGTETRYAYVEEGDRLRDHNLSSITYPGSLRVAYEYDALGRIAGRYVGDGDERVRLEYPAAGKTVVTDALGKQTTLWMDSRGRIARSTDPNGNSVRAAYDAAGRLTNIVDPAGYERDFGYTILGDVKSLRTPVGGETAISYGGEFNAPSRIEDARGNGMGFGYDDAGSLSEVTYADGSSELLSRGAGGLLSSWTNRRQQRIGAEWNVRGQLAVKTRHDGSQVRYVYDARGRVERITDARGTTTIAYVADRDLVARITYPDGRWLAFMYDDAGRRTRMTDRDGFVVQYGYDASGRLAALRDGQERLVERYAYDQAGRLSRVDKGNGTYTTYGYDAAGRALEVLNHAPGGAVNSGFVYTYDARGLRSSMSVTLGAMSQGLWSFDYDEGGRLTRAVFASANAAVPNQELSYRYDRVGNRVRSLVQGTAVDYTTNDLDQYVAVGEETLAYDPDGNLIAWTRSSERVTYTYDEQNRLTSVERRSGETAETWSYEYDCFGNRVACVADGKRTEYLVDPFGMGNVVAEYDGGGALVARYVHGQGLSARVSPAGESSFYGFDALGSTSDISGPDGRLLNSYLYRPFGEKLSASESIANRFGYIGRFGVADDGHGQLYMRARQYSPELGRFASLDPLRLQTLETYQYACNDPCLFSDPRGLRVVSWDYSAGLFFFVGGIVSVSVAYDFVTTDVAIVATGGVGLGLGFTNGPGQSIYADAITRIPDLYGYSWSQWLPLLAVDRNAANELIGLSLSGLSLLDAKTMNWSLLSPVWNLHQIHDWIEDTLVNLTSITIVRSHTPEDKFGPAGYDSADTPAGAERRFVRGDTVYRYRIEFWNKPTAVVPTQDALIVDRLDPRFDWRTLALTRIGFLRWDIELPGGQAIDTWVDMRPDMDVIVKVSATLDQETGEIRWWFHCVDPLTGDYPDTYEGFLPPFNEKTGYELGWVEFTVHAAEGLPSGTVIANQAFVEFDFAGDLSEHPAPKEGPFANTIDALPPTSRVDARTEPGGKVSLAVSAQDDAGGSGVAGCDIYVADDDGTPTLWKSDARAVEEFEGLAGHCYKFFSVARDNVGLQEAFPAVPNAVICIDGDQSFRRGYINEDAARNIADAIFLLGYLFASGRAPECLDAADTNDDARVNIADAIRLLGHLFASTGQLPEPFAACGADPTADQLDCAGQASCAP